MYKYLWLFVSDCLETLEEIKEEGREIFLENGGEKFKCNIPGWCSSSAAWAYEPGVGAHWQDAWSKTGDCDGGDGTSPEVNIIAPLNGTTYNENSDITINANATDDGTITLVEFFNGTVKLGEDTTSPYSYTINNAQDSSYLLTAVATDNDNNKTTSSDVLSRKNTGDTGGDIPGKILVGYWHNFNNVSNCLIDMNDHTLNLKLLIFNRY